MANMRNQLLSFSVGDLSCQLLRAFRSLRNPLPSPGSLLSHIHPFWELHYISQGRCSYAINQTLYDLDPDQLLIIPPGTKHLLTQNAAPTTCLTLSLHIQAPASQAHASSQALYSALHVPNPILLTVRAESSLGEALRRIDALTQKDDQVFSVQESLRAYATLLIAALSEALVEHPVPGSNPPSHLSAPQSFLINQFFCSASMNDGAVALAQALGVSPRQLDRILLNLFGMNFRQKLNQTKLNYAIDLLSNKTLGIEEAAHLLGYSSSTAFGTFIKKATGLTPSPFRRALLSTDAP